LEKREISAEIIKKFRIGFAPESWDAVMSLLKEKGADEKTIEASGLVSINEEKKRVYDRFRGRIMFPVLNVDGNPVAFGARILAQGEPKYLNSPETPAYVKGEHLYGLYQSKEEIRKKKYAILVEGYLDLIALYQFGVTNCVASLGTAFTEQQSKLLGRFARKVVVNYDGDKAGVKAARRAIETLLAEDFEIKVLVLPDGQDPDDYIRASGFAAYKKQHEQHAHTYLQFILEQVSKEYNINRPEQRQKAVDEMLPFISGVQNLVQKRTVFDEIMGFLRVDKSVSSDLWKSLRVNQKVDSKLLKRILPKMTVAEQRLLELLIYDKDLREIILPQIEETDYEGLATAAVFRALVEIDRRNAEISLENLMEVIGDDEMANDFVPVLMLSESPRETGEALDEVLIQAENCVATLREMAISNRILEISQELMLAEQSGNDELLGQLVGEQIDLARMKHELQNRLVEN
jgi:DNA primase